MMGLPRSVADALDEMTYSQRALAYLQVDAELRLVGAGGNLENYGLAAVRPGQPAPEQALFLEGLLPLPETPFSCRHSSWTAGAPRMCISTWMADAYGSCSSM